MKLKVALVTLCGLLSFSASADVLRLKNYKEIYASYVNITGVDGNQADLRELLRLNVDRMPKNGTPDELSSGVVLASTEIGATFCKKAIDQEKVQTNGERILFGDIDFDRGPEQFTDYLREKIADDLAVAFWQRNVSLEEKKLISVMLANLAKEGPDKVDETIKVLQILCTTYATSLAFLVK